MCAMPWISDNVRATTSIFAKKNVVNLRFSILKCRVYLKEIDSFWAKTCSTMDASDAGQHRVMVQTLVKGRVVNGYFF